MNKKHIIIGITVLIAIVFGCLKFSSYAVANKINEQLKLANKYLQEGRYEEAILAFQKVIEIEPKNLPARLGLGKSYFAAGKSDKAEAVLKEASDIDPKNMDVQMELSKLYITSGNLMESEKALNKLIQIDSKNPRAYIELANIYIKQNRLDEAEKVLMKAISINTNIPELYIELAKLYISQNKQIDALRILNEAKKITEDKSILSMIADISSKISLTYISQTILQGDRYSLPDKVNVKIGGSEIQMPVNWGVYSLDTSQVGKYEYNGLIEYTDKRVQLILNIIGISAIDDINFTVKQNEKYSLPAKVSVRMSDNSTLDIPVVWDPSKVETSNAGTYSFQGTVDRYNSKIKLTLKVESIEPDFTVFIKNTDKPQISAGPGKVDNNELWIKYSDGREEFLISCKRGTKSEDLIAGIHSPQISVDKTKIYFLSACAVTSKSVHVYDLKTKTERFVCFGNFLKVIEQGAYKGNIIVNQHRYNGPPNYGASDYYYIIDDYGKEIKNLGPKLEGF